MSSICNCPNPPGGQVKCGPNQMAVCRVENGVAIAECIDAPIDLLIGVERRGSYLPPSAQREIEGRRHRARVWAYNAATRRNLPLTERLSATQLEVQKQ